MNKRSFYILCGLVITLSFSVSATAALIPSIAKYFQADPLLVGRLIWIYMLPYGLCALIWGPLTRKFSTKKILLSALFGFSLCSLGVSVSGTLTQTFLARMGMGIFGSCFVPLSLIIIGKQVPAATKPKYVGFLFSTSFLASLVGLFLSGFLPWRTIYLIPFITGSVCFFLGADWLHNFNYTGVFKISYRETFKDKSVLRLFVAICAGSFLYHSIQQWLGVYLSQGYNFQQFSISMVFTIASLLAIFSESIGGVLATRWPAIRIATFGLISMSVFVFLLFSLSPSYAIFFIIVFWGVGWAFNHVGLSSILTRLPDQFLRDASSLNSSLRFFAGGLGAYFGGKIIAVGGFRLHFFIVGLGILFLGIYLNKIVIGQERS